MSVPGPGGRGAAHFPDGHPACPRTGSSGWGFESRSCRPRLRWPQCITLVLENESGGSPARADGLPGGHALHVGRAWGSPRAHPVGMLPFQEEKGEDPNAGRPGSPSRAASDSSLSSAASSMEAPRLWE